MIRTLVLLLFFSTELLAQHVEYKSFPSKLLGRDLKYGVYLPPSYARSPARNIRFCISFTACSKTKRAGAPGDKRIRS